MTNDNLADFIRDHREDFDGDDPAPNLWGRISTSLGDNGDDPDPLERFVAQNREAFDDVSPPPRIEQQLFAPALRVSHSKVGRGRRRLPLIMGIAASFLLLLSAAYFIGSRAGYQAGQYEQLANQIESIDPELAEAERYYQEEIAVQFTKVSQYNHDPQLRRDLDEIDQVTAEIRADLFEVPPSHRAELVNQLIETYRTKLDILLRIQQHINYDDPRPGFNLPTNES